MIYSIKIEKDSKIDTNLIYTNFDSNVISNLPTNQFNSVTRPESQEMSINDKDLDKVKNIPRLVKNDYAGFDLYKDIEIIEENMGVFP